MQIPVFLVQLLNKLVSLHCLLKGANNLPLCKFLINPANVPCWDPKILELILRNGHFFDGVLGEVMNLNLGLWGPDLEEGVRGGDANLGRGAINAPVETGSVLERFPAAEGKGKGDSGPFYDAREEDSIVRILGMLLFNNFPFAV
jgi:hypothetical protein